MLFSAGFDSYKCKDCEKECTNVVPTSIIPMGACCALAGGVWALILKAVVLDHWLMNVGGFAIAFLVLWSVYETTERLTNRAIRSGECPYCHGELASTGHGFYDGFMPNPWELVIYATTVALSMLALFVYRAFTQVVG